MDKITKRLSRDVNYNPPEKTYQSTLNEEDIASKLVDYSRVRGTDIFDVPLGTHIRYFSVDQKTGRKQFRMGGTLTKIGDNKEYIVCSNGTFTWTVQLANSILYKKLSPEELAVKIKKSVMKTTEVEIDKVKDENRELKKIIKQIKEATIREKNKKN